MKTTQDDDRQQSLTLLAAVVDDAVEPLDRLDALRALGGAVDVVERAAVAAARAGGASWADVGARLGVSKQAVAKRFGERRERPDKGETPVMPGAGERRPKEWAVTTPRGRTLLRVVKRH